MANIGPSMVLASAGICVCTYAMPCPSVMAKVR